MVADEQVRLLRMSQHATVRQRQRQLLRKPERRAQLIAAAARAFVRAGFTATSLEDVAAEAQVTKVVIYHHFASKRDLYLAVLHDTRDRVSARIGTPEEAGPDAFHRLALAARENPDGFRLLYRHASREPEFADHVVDVGASGAATAEARLRDQIPDPAHRAWIATLINNVVVDAALTWLDADQPVPPERLAETMGALAQALLATNS